jgi:hypothetical protein
MKTIYVASSAWLSDQSHCEALVKKIILANPDKAESLILDAATVRREAASQSGCEYPQIIEIDFRTWVSETLTEGGVINIEAIRRATTKMAEDKVFAINAIGFDANTVRRALTQLRIGFYTLTDWPPGLVLIGDDSQLHQVSPMLANTFYIQPSIVAKVEMRRIVWQIALDGLLLRNFGRRAGVVLKFINYLNGVINKFQQKKQQKEKGLFFEE